jgi:polysaccharide export outer membrane protein
VRQTFFSTVRHLVLLPPVNKMAPLTVASADAAANDAAVRVYLRATRQPQGWRSPCTCSRFVRKDLLLRAARVALSCAALGAAGCGAKAPAIVTAPSAPVYVIGVSDLLTVTFWQDQNAVDVVVRPDGKISVPLLNDVQAAGLTPEQLALALEEAASKYITEPDATVMVKEVRSRKVFVLGEVGNPGMVPLSGDMTVLQLIAISGGLLEYADKKNIVIIRTENGQEQRLKFNYNDVVGGKNLQQNIFLQPGDTVVVSESGVGLPGLFLF